MSPAKSSHGRKRRATPYVKPRYQDGICVALAILSEKTSGDHFTRDDIIDEWTSIMQDAGKPIHPRGRGYLKTVLRDLIHYEFIEKMERGSDVYRMKKNLRVLIGDEKVRTVSTSEEGSSSPDHPDAVIERFRYYFKNIGVLKKPTRAELYELNTDLLSQISQLRRDQGIMSDNEEEEMSRERTLDAEMQCPSSELRELQATLDELPPPPDSHDEEFMEVDQEPEAGPSNILSTSTPTRQALIQPADNYPTPKSAPYYRARTAESRRRRHSPSPIPGSPTPFLRSKSLMTMAERKPSAIDKLLKTHNAELELANAALKQINIRLETQLEESEEFYRQTIEEQEIERLRFISEEKSTEVEYLRRDRDELEARIEAHEQRLQKLTQDLHILQYTLDDLECENEVNFHMLEDYREQLQVERTLLQDSLEESRKLSEDRDKGIAEREQQQKSFILLLEKYGKLEDDYEEAVKERDGAKGQCGKYKARIRRLEQHAQRAKALLEVSLGEEDEDEDDSLHLDEVLGQS